ncbi:MAG: HdeD family acid-resistance protein [Rubellimicrobium sp.]|nr:HdeD family acid-resistance protein [Rubellimicrobium sp.]
MTIETSASDSYRESARRAVRRYSLFYLAQAGLLVAAGIFAILFPYFTSTAFVWILGWLLVITGIVQGIGLVGARESPSFWPQLISVVLSVLIGALLLRDLDQAMVVVSILLIVLFMIDGIARIVFALAIRPLTNWFYVFLSGVIGVALSVWLWSSMPGTATWLIGLMLGINLISAGATLGWLAWQVRKATN